MKIKTDPRTWTNEEVELYLNSYSQQKLIPCGECLLRYSSFQAAKRHLALCHRQGDLKCDSKDCSFSCSTASELTTHKMFCCTFNEKRINISSLKKGKKMRKSIDPSKEK